MKAYYLQMANIMNVKYAEGHSETLSLLSLYRKIRQFINILQIIGMHEWGKGISEIQKACGVYMLQKEIPPKTLLQTNEAIGLHLQFLMQLAGNVGFLKQLEGILQYHYKNVEYLFKKQKEEQPQPPLQE